jgi:hypothetical protein
MLAISIGRFVMRLTDNQSLEEFIRICEHFLSDDITPEKMTDQELVIVRMFLELVGDKYNGQ